MTQIAQNGVKSLSRYVVKSYCLSKDFLLSTFILCLPFAQVKLCRVKGKKKFLGTLRFLSLFCDLLHVGIRAFRLRKQTNCRVKGQLIFWVLCVFFPCSAIYFPSTPHSTLIIPSNHPNDLTTFRLNDLTAKLPTATELYNY